MALRKRDEEIEAITPAGPLPVLLPTTFAHQKRSNWCWASCCDMALSQQNQPQVTQCDIAGSYFLDDDDCCLPGHCDSECAIDDVKKIFQANGLPGTDFVPHDITECRLIEQLRESKNTVALGLAGSPNHMVLVVGFAGALFNVYDPALGEGAWTFEEIKQGALGNRTWAQTWTDLR